jgi:O-antigen/teichoic acid export membrane protein
MQPTVAGSLPETDLIAGSESTVTTAAPAQAPKPAASAPQPVGSSLKSAAVFGFGAAMQRGVAFLLLPLYTRALTPAQYGTLSVLLAITSVAGIVFAFGLDMGLFRSFFLHAEDRRRVFVGSVWRLLVVAPVVGAIVCAAIAAPFLHGIPRVTPLDVFLALLAGALYVGASAVPLVVLRVQRRLRDFLALSLVDAIATPTLTIILVVVLHKGILGWLIASAASNAILLVAAFRIVPWERGVPFERDTVVGAMRFGATLIPHAFALWALFLIDRGVLAGLVSAHELGVYSLAANLAVPVAIAITSLNQAMMPAYASAGVHPEQRDHLANLIVIQLTGVFAICLTGALLGGPVLLLVAPHSYHDAAPLVAWIVLGYAFLGLYFVPMNGITLGAGRSGFVWVVSVLGAASNVALLLIFVPADGIMAAAIASAAAYLVLFVCISVYARRPENPVRYRWPPLLGAAALAAFVYVAATFTTPSQGGAAIGLRLVWIAAFLGVCVGAYQLRRVARPALDA